MTAYQERLLDEAMEQWSQGHPIDTVLFAKMAQEGLDVEALETIHLKED